MYGGKWLQLEKKWNIIFSEIYKMVIQLFDQAIAQNRVFLYYIEGDNEKDEEVKVKAYVVSRGVGQTRLLLEISEEINDYIIKNIKLPSVEYGNDRPWCMENTKCTFTVKFVWHLVRHKENIL